MCTKIVCSCKGINASHKTTTWLLQEQVCRRIEINIGEQVELPTRVCQSGLKYQNCSKTTILHVTYSRKIPTYVWDGQTFLLYIQFYRVWKTTQLYTLCIVIITCMLLWLSYQNANFCKEVENISLDVLKIWCLKSFGTNAPVPVWIWFGRRSCCVHNLFARLTGYKQ